MCGGQEVSFRTASACLAAFVIEQIMKSDRQCRMRGEQFGEDCRPGPADLVAVHIQM